MGAGIVMESDGFQVVELVDFKSDPRKSYRVSGHLLERLVVDKNKSPESE